MKTKTDCKHKFFTLALSALLASAFCFFQTEPMKALAEDVIPIGNAEELMAMADNPSGSYLLMNDIDLAGIDWTPFSFSGKLDGNGYTILNLTANRTGATAADTYDGNMKQYETYFAGLFDVLRDGTISNLNLLGVNIAVNSDMPCFLGGIAGYMDHGTISGCSVTATLELQAYDRMFGVGGIIGYGNGVIENTYADVTLICIDTDATTRDEQFLGGACATGYPDVNNCVINIAGFISEHGYVHSGGLIGMYMFSPAGINYYGSITDNTVNGKITFFEDNTNRRAYCKDIVGEIVTWDYNNGRNKSDFIRDERFEYDIDLRPHSCTDFTVTETVTGPTHDSFGFTTSVCDACGYTEVNNYTLKKHTIESWVVTKEPTYEEAGCESGTCIYCDYTENRELAKLVPEPEPEPTQPPESVTDEASREEVPSRKLGSLQIIVIVFLLIGSSLITIRKKKK